VISDELVPIFRREHRFLRQLTEVCPAGAQRAVEYGTDRVRIARRCTTDRDMCGAHTPRTSLTAETNR
jgi:hypothetical protein